MTISAFFDNLRFPRRPDGALAEPPPPAPEGPFLSIPRVDVTGLYPPRDTRTGRTGRRCWCCGTDGRSFCPDRCRNPRRVSKAADASEAFTERSRQQAEALRRTA